MKTNNKKGLSERLDRAEEELERHDVMMGMLFVGLVVIGLVGILALGMAVQALGELREVVEQLDLLRSRITEITAEIRGIGG